MIVTTSQAPTTELLRYAKKLADEWSIELVDRRQWSVNKLFARYPTSKILVATEHELRLYDRSSVNKPLVYHPSMAYVKLKAMLQGKEEIIIKVSGCKPGDIVIDCTAGLCSDSLLFSLAVGEQGRIVALESEPWLYLIVREGLAHYNTENELIRQAMRRIKLLREHHEDYLASLPDKSVDIVYFDPMFRQPLHESSAIGEIRLLTNNNALTEHAIEQAKRVARKCIILKEHALSTEFERLGFERCQDVRGQRVAYGKIPL